MGGLPLDEVDDQGVPALIIDRPAGRPAGLPGPACLAGRRGGDDPNTTADGRFIERHGGGRPGGGGGGGGGGGHALDHTLRALKKSEISGSNSRRYVAYDIYRWSLFWRHLPLVGTIVG